MSCCCCFWVGGEMQTPRYAYWTNSVIYIPMDDQGASHARLLPGNRGERDKKEGKREKKLMLLPKWEGRLCIEDTVKYHCCGLFLAFTPPPTPPKCHPVLRFSFSYNLSHWYKVCSFQRHNNWADSVLCLDASCCIPACEGPSTAPVTPDNSLLMHL